MIESKIVCVVPSIRPEGMAEFRKAWAKLFEKHRVTLVAVWDGEEPLIERNYTKFRICEFPIKWSVGANKDLFCRRTDAIRNAGFVFAAGTINPEYILTLDDDVHPPAGSDPIQEHLDVLQRRVPISWMNTSINHGVIMERPIHNTVTDPVYLRGFPYGIRDEAPVKVSHGVWVNVPDFDGKTQLELGKCQVCKGKRTIPEGGEDCHRCGGTNYDGSRLPYSLPYFRGPIPRGVYFPFCGMNVMVHRDALPYLYFAPMGWDTGCEGLVDKDGLVRGPALNRFADIWCGILLKRVMDANNWAIYTGASTVIHTRASDPFKNVKQEKLGVKWNEWAWKLKYGTDVDSNDPAFLNYWRSYLDKAARFRDLIRKLQGGS